VLFCVVDILTEPLNGVIQSTLAPILQFKRRSNLVVPFGKALRLGGTDLEKRLIWNNPTVLPFGPCEHRYPVGQALQSPQGFCRKRSKSCCTVNRLSPVQIE